MHVRTYQSEYDVITEQIMVNKKMFKRADGRGRSQLPKNSERSSSRSPKVCDRAKDKAHEMKENGLNAHDTMLCPLPIDSETLVTLSDKDGTRARLCWSDQMYEAVCSFVDKLKVVELTRMHAGETRLSCVQPRIRLKARSRLYQ
jgi:hypothetical protein